MEKSLIVCKTFPHILFKMVFGLLSMADSGDVCPHPLPHDPCLLVFTPWVILSR